MVRCHLEDVLVIGQFQKRESPQGALVQVERRPGFSQGKFVCPPRPLGRGDCTQVDPPECDRRFLRDHANRISRGHGKCGSQAFVAVHDRATACSRAPASRMPSSR